MTLGRPRDWKIQFYVKAISSVDADVRIPDWQEALNLGRLGATKAAYFAEYGDALRAALSGGDCFTSVEVDEQVARNMKWLKHELGFELRGLAARLGLPERLVE